MKLFRVAAPASTARHVTATLLQTLVFWSAFLWLLPSLVASCGRRLGLPPLGCGGAAAAAIGLFGVAGVFGIATGTWMAVRGRGTPLPTCTARELVTSGPYRWLRNPMALAGITQGIAVGIWLDDVLVVHYALAGACLWHFIARPPEERDLAARFGAAYDAYRERVGVWVPLLPHRVEFGLAAALGAVAVAFVLTAGGGDERVARSPFVLLLVLAASLLATRGRKTALDRPVDHSPPP